MRLLGLGRGGDRALPQGLRLSAGAITAEPLRQEHRGGQVTGRVNTAFWHGGRARRVLLDRRPEAPEPPVVRGQGSGVRRRLPCIREQAFGNREQLD